MWGVINLPEDMPVIYFANPEIQIHPTGVCWSEYNNYEQTI